VARLYRERRPLYEELADIAIDVDGIRAGEVVDRILAALHGADGPPADE
jgi:shikimate kinase